MAEQVTIYDKTEYSVGIADAMISLYVSRSGTGGHFLSELILHTHSCWEVFVCLRGMIFLETESGNIILSAGDAAIVPPELSHHKLPGTQDEDAEWSSIAFDLKRRERVQGGNLFQELEEFCAGEQVLVFRKAPEFCRGIQALSGENDRPEDVLPVLKLTQLLLELTRREAPVTERMEHGDSQQKRITILEDLISGRFMEPLTPAAVAKALNISPRHLSRIMQKRYGDTFVNVIHRKRMETAERLLLSTNSSVETIGREVGFKSKSLFFRTFHEHFGMSPAAYRRVHKDCILKPDMV